MSSPAFSGTGRPLTQTGVDKGITTLGVSKASFWAVMTVETRGFGFLPDRRPLILYERHIFHQRTGGHFSSAHPDISNPKAGGYGAGGANQFDRLARAIELDEKAALESASWGLGQVMGFNAGTAGYPSTAEMVAAMAESEDAQMQAMVNFIEKNKLAKFLIAHNWAEFAKRYNGAEFEKNNYDVKLENAFNLYDKHPTPDLNVRLAQASLLYLGFNPKGVDGVFGMGTQTALIAYQKKKKLPPDGKLSKDIIAELESDAF